MAKLRRGTQTALSEAASLRLRAAWLYYNHGLTQKEVAEQLGISRTTVIRLLDEALKRREVQIWIEEGEAKCMELAVDLERTLGLDEAIVVPETRGFEQTATAVGLALGKFLSEAITDHMTIGVGWGRTLTASLASFRPPRHEGVKVMSLLGGSIETQFTNPVEYSWRMAGQLGAECYLFPAPLIVDSVETKKRLIEKCGLHYLYELATGLDLAVVSVGDIAAKTTSLARLLLPEDDLDELIALGCVGDVMCNFLDAEGRTVPHQINKRIMSIDMETLKSAKHIVIACGGTPRAKSIAAAIKRLGCNTLVTDEGAGRAILALARAGARAA
jgi:DNA-binding transcriptional regulator LsrR (DeoR family)